ncbi:MAG TPA: FAD/NAD(P)-binding protein [Edaphobacter sp.]|nr:FAD/NAD(P)-binding protein [Edaphobacter sp.]
MRRLRCDVAIIGGGYSGVVLAVQLLRRCHRAMSIVIVDRSSRPGRGVAFGTRCCEHLLNIRAKNMSVLAGCPDHFTNWMKESGSANFAPDAFVPRSLYGEYIEQTLRSTLESNPDCQVTYLTGNAISLARSEAGFEVCLEDGSNIQSAVVVLAMGNSRPSDPLLGKTIEQRFYADYAWDDRTLRDIPTEGSVLLIGSGLTAIDQVLGLKAQGFLGTVTMVSRRGKLPAVHCSSVNWSVNWAESLPATVSSAIHEVRHQIDIASQNGVDWRSVIDSLRPWTSVIWNRWSLQEKRRFLRHLRPFWEASRHRLPQATHQSIQELMAFGALRVLAGRITEATRLDTNIDVSVVLRGTHKTVTISTDKIINCTSSGTSDQRQEPFIKSLLLMGFASYDPLRIGISTDNHGCVIGAFGKSTANLYALGPLRKATFWETTAVPEIREQALELAERIVSQL